MRAEFSALWAPVLDRLLALPGGWFLRDYHSPNLIWLPEREGIARVGIIDFQDALNEHFAFDLVSLLQDARVTVPEELEAELFAYYCAEIARREPAFDRAAFAAAYADFGAQRNTRLLGLWAATAEAGRQAAVSPAYSAHLGISCPQPAGAGTRKPRGVVRPALPARLCGARPCCGEAEARIAGMAVTLNTAMLLSAGLGKRMAPAANGLPKPLVLLHGKALIDHVLDRLAAAGVARAIVNVHYKADLIERTCRNGRPRAIEISDERAALLDTGGGVKKALPRLGPGPFLIHNADSVWIEGVGSNLARLAGGLGRCAHGLPAAAGGRLGEPRLPGARRLRAGKRRPHPPPQGRAGDGAVCVHGCVGGASAFVRRQP